MTVRTRLMILTVLGLVVTMAVWGWVQIRAIDQILVEQQGKRLSSVAETVSTYYQHFPTGHGLSALDTSLKEQVQSDVRLARIDIFTVVNYDIDYIEYIAGASRVRERAEVFSPAVIFCFIPGAIFPMIRFPGAPCARARLSTRRRTE